MGNQFSDYSWKHGYSEWKENLTFQCIRAKVGTLQRASLYLTFDTGDSISFREFANETLAKLLYASADSHYLIIRSIPDRWDFKKLKYVSDLRWRVVKLYDSHIPFGSPVPHGPVNNPKYELEFSGDITRSVDKFICVYQLYWLQKVRLRRSPWIQVFDSSTIKEIRRLLVGD